MSEKGFEFTRRRCCHYIAGRRRWLSGPTLEKGFGFTPFTSRRWLRFHCFKICRSYGRIEESMLIESCVHGVYMSDSEYWRKMPGTSNVANRSCVEHEFDAY